MKIIDLLENESSLVKELSRYRSGEFFIHFSNDKTLGINPNAKSYFPTPLGIYTYPVKEYWNNIVSDDIPTGSDRKYCLLMKIDPSANYVYDLAKSYTDRMLKRDVDSIMRAYGRKLGKKELEQEILYATRDLQPKNAGNYFWNITKAVSEAVGGNHLAEWNKLLQSLGYDGFGDISGNGLIHPKEPVQCVFLNTGAVKLLKAIPNTNK